MAVIKSAPGQMEVLLSRNYLIKEHLPGPSVGIKNWPGCVSRYKHYRKDNLSRLVLINKQQWRECQFFICGLAEVFGWHFACRGTNFINGQ